MHFINIAMLSGLIAVSGLAQAQQTPLKVGYVNAAKLVEQAPQGEAALEKLEAEFGPRDRELRTMRDEINGIEDDLEKNRLVMSDSELQRLEVELRDKRRRLKRSRDEFREDYNLRRNEELNKLQRIVTEAIVAIARDEGYDLIFQEAVYASKRLDITSSVLKKLAEM